MLRVQWEEERCAANHSSEWQGPLERGSAHQVHMPKACSGSEIVRPVADSVGLLEARQQKATVLKVGVRGRHDLPNDVKDLCSEVVVD
jgi:hypothetical protein